MALEHRLRGCGTRAQLLSCSKACAVFLDQGGSPRLLPCKEDSQPPDCQGSPRVHSCGCTFHGFGQIDNGKDPDAGEDWGQEETRVTEDEMAGWHHRFNGHEFEQAPGYREGQESLALCSSWGR